MKHRTCAAARVRGTPRQPVCARARGTRTFAFIRDLHPKPLLLERVQDVGVCDGVGGVEALLGVEALSGVEAL